MNTYKQSQQTTTCHGTWLRIPQILTLTPYQTNMFLDSRTAFPWILEQLHLCPLLSPCSRRRVFNRYVCTLIYFYNFFKNFTSLYSSVAEFVVMHLVLSSFRCAHINEINETKAIKYESIDNSLEKLETYK